MVDLCFVRGDESSRFVFTGFTFLGDRTASLDGAWLALVVGSFDCGWATAAMTAVVVAGAPPAGSAELELLGGMGDLVLVRMSRGTFVLFFGDSSGMAKDGILLLRCYRYWWVNVPPE